MQPQPKKNKDLDKEEERLRAKNAYKKSDRKRAKLELTENYISEQLMRLEEEERSDG